MAVGDDEGIAIPYKKPLIERRASSQPAVAYSFDVTMTCGGCSGAITRVLDRSKSDGSVKSFTVDLDNQAVDVEQGTLSYDDVLAKIRKTGKAVNYGKDGDKDAEAYTDLGKAKLDGSVPKTARKL